MNKTRIINNRINNLLLALCLITILSIFLPWGHVESSVSYRGDSSYNNSSFRTAGISGISFNAGFFAFATIAFYVYLIYNKKLRPRYLFVILPWAIFFTTFGFIHTLSKSKISSQSGYGEFSSKISGAISAEYGFLLFILFSILILIFSAFRTKKIISSALGEVSHSEQNALSTEQNSEISLATSSITLNDSQDDINEDKHKIQKHSTVDEKQMC
ncbi:MAG: hypothetical protein IPJ86_06450 [Bacteroidetes bacterium]|nr:hypothetical protein [Bacteroidota bacterium]